MSCVSGCGLLRANGPAERVGAGANVEVSVDVGGVPIRIYFDAKCKPDAGCSPMVCLQIGRLPPLCRGI